MDSLRLGYEWNPVTGRIGAPVNFDLSSHLTLLGPTRCGKGATLEIPNLLLGLRDCSVVSIDPTGQNASVCAEARRRAGHRVLVLNPQGLHVGLYPDLQSVGCNPVVAGIDPKSPRFFEEAAAIGEALVSVDGETQKHWPESARGLITGLVMWVRLRDGDNAHLGTVLQLLTEAETTDSKSRPTAGLRYTAAQMIASGHFVISSLAGRFIKDGSREIDSIRSTAETAMRWLLSEPMRADLMKNGIDWGSLTETETTVFVILPAEDLEFHSVWLKLMTACALNAIYRKAGSGRVEVLFMLAEFFALGTLKPVLAAMGQSAKYGVRLWPVLQDVGQLATLYGPHGAGTFLSNSGCVFAFRPNHPETANFLSEYGDEQVVPSISASDDPHAPGGVRINVGTARERIWSPGKLRSIPKFHGLVWFDGQSQPQPVYCPPYWDIAACRSLARPDPYHRGDSGPADVGRRFGRMAGFGVAGAALLGGAVALGLAFVPIGPVPSPPVPAVSHGAPVHPVPHHAGLRPARPAATR